MENRWEKLSESIEILRSAAALFLLVMLLGMCLFAALCVIVGAMTYASLRLKIEPIAQSTFRRLPFTRART